MRQSERTKLIEVEELLKLAFAALSQLKPNVGAGTEYLRSTIAVIEDLKVAEKSHAEN